MKKLLIFVSLATLLGACRMRSGSGNIISDKRSVENFTGIKASQGFEVFVTTGESASLIIEADDNLMKYVEAEVQNGVLKIGIENDVSISNGHLKATVTVPYINLIKASSGAEVEVTNILKADKKIILDASSAGEIRTEADAPSIEAEASSGSHITVKGRTMNFKAKASSGASVSAKALLSENTRVDCSSGGSASVHASVNLDAEASSGGTITYAGSPSVKVKQSSGGSVGKE